MGGGERRVIEAVVVLAGTDREAMQVGVGLLSKLGASRGGRAVGADLAARLAWVDSWSMLERALMGGASDAASLLFPEVA
jgi:hypothetical protein